MARIVPVLVSVAFASLAACATPGPVTPVEVVEAQAAALRDGDLASAHALLTPKARMVAPQWPRASVLTAPLDPGEVSRTARWEEAGTTLLLERAAGGWRIKSGVLGLMRAGTPEEALTSFSMAILSRDYRALLGLLPDRERPSWTADRLAGALDVPDVRARWVELAKAVRAQAPSLTWIDRARVRASVGGSTIVLVREGGGWKVFDVLPGSDYIPH
ncbi:MAG: hypothetical protein EP329_20515 [Deltaproteobacteria bacterium]|nr:MAG: hypothetical protein EP329_20515 [Deltaproteobacteria bacterium]